VAYRVIVLSFCPRSHSIPPKCRCPPKRKNLFSLKPKGIGELVKFGVKDLEKINKGK
jgi:hypothetical protein